MPLDFSRIRAITLDLDDTLWPVWPTIERAEQVLQDWLRERAPAAHALCERPGARAQLRAQALAALPGRTHDLSAVRLESIRLALAQAGEDETLAPPAFEVFFAERHRVDLFGDALPALEFLSQRCPLIALTNGNADVGRVGIGRYFSASVSAREVGFAKPDARMFQRAAEVAGVPAGAVLHIGDDPEHDGQGALAAGMQMAWINRSGKAWDRPQWTPHLAVAGLDALCAQWPGAAAGLPGNLSSTPH